MDKDNEFDFDVLVNELQLVAERLMRLEGPSKEQIESLIRAASRVSDAAIYHMGIFSLRKMAERANIEASFEDELARLLKEQRDTIGTDQLSEFGAGERERFSS